MTPADFSEHTLVDVPAVALFRDLGYTAVSGFDETFGPHGTLGRETTGCASLAQTLRWPWQAGKFQDNDVARFLQLDEKRLCFKLEVKAKDTSLRAGAWREWCDAPSYNSAKEVRGPTATARRSRATRTMTASSRRRLRRRRGTRRVARSRSGNVGT